MPLLTVRSLGDKATELKLKRFAADHNWIIDNYPALVKEHSDAYIAVLNRRVEFEDADLTRLTDKIADSGKDVNDYAVELVTAKPRGCLY